MRLIRLVEVALCAVILTAAAAAARAADPVKIRIGWIAAPANFAPILFAKPGIAQYLGKTYELEPIRFNGSPPMITALSAGELDIALLAYSSFALAIENAKMDDLRAIADDFQGNVPGTLRTDIWFSKTARSKGSTTLRARFSRRTVLAVRSVSRLRVALRNHKLEDKRDVVSRGKLAEYEGHAEEHKVDLIPAVIPFAYYSELIKVSRMLFTQGESVGLTQTLLWAARTGFLQKDSRRDGRFHGGCPTRPSVLFRPENHNEAVEIVSKFTKQPPEFLRVGCSPERTIIAIRMPCPICNPCSLISTTKRKSDLLKNVRRSENADLSITKEADERLKKRDATKIAASGQAAGLGRAGVRRRQDVVLQPADASISTGSCPLPLTTGACPRTCAEHLFHLVPTDFDPVRHSCAGTSSDRDDIARRQGRHRRGSLGSVGEC